MFRIHISRASESTSFTVEGKLTGPWVKELERCWRAEVSAEPTKPIVVNLTAVLFVDADGRELLMEMRRERTTFVVRGCLMKALVEDVESRLSSEKSKGETA